MAIDRAIAIVKMRGAFRTGLSAAAFIRQMKDEGLSYRRTDMLSDWRSVNELETKAEAFKYVRKDYYPTEKSIAQVEWELSKEFMYKVRVESRLRPDQPISSRFVNIMSDTPMTPRMVEQAVVDKWVEWEKYKPEIIEVITPVTAVHRSELWQQ